MIFSYGVSPLRVFSRLAKLYAMRNVAERDDIMFEIEQSNKSDDNFTNTLTGTVEVAYGAYDAFKGGTFEQKRRLLNFAFDHLESKGSTLCYTLKKPFDRFVNLSKIEEWRALEDLNL